MRLQFASTDERLFGRAKELQILEEVYRQIQQKRGSSHQRNYVDNPQSDDVPSSAGPYLVLLKGMSGNGKTSLVNHFGISCGVAAAAQNTERTDTESRQRLRKHHYNSCYVKGKFNEQHQKPYAAFVEAFEDLLTHILKNRDPETERLSAIRKALQEDEILMEILPSLCDILWSNEDHNNEVTGVLNCDMIPNAPLNSEQAKGQMGRTRRRSRANPMQEELQHSTDGDHPDTLAEEGTMLEQRRQFYYRFQAFVRAVCNDQPYPLILFLDDLQWADSASLELFKAILGDTVSTNLLVVGAYRGQEVEDEEHPLRTALNQLKDPMMEHGRYRELSLNDLELADLNEFVAASLELAPEKTMSLSQVIQRKTHGNIFFSREFLKNLEAQKLLRFDMTFYQWTWQAEEISGSTNISDNVVDLVAVRIRQLPDSAIWILKVCSCLWFSFDSAILELIVMQTREEFENPRKLGQKLLATTLEDRFEKIGNLKIDVKTQSEVVQGLLLATEQGLLDQVQSTSFKFAHDKIREASYGLIREGDERDRMHFVIGEALFRMYHSDQSQQWMLFSSVDQLNKISSHVHSSKLRVRLAEVNLEAAEVATSISAFLPSITYLKAGIKLLGETRWCYQYDLCLKLHSKLAALESSVGQTQEATLVIEEIVNHAESFEDKVSAFTTQIESLSVQGKLHQSLDLAFQVVDGLGEHFPLSAKGKNFERRVAEDKAKTARLLRNHTDATILNLPLMKDEKKQYALRILNLMVDPSFHTGQISKLFLIINRMVRISIASGLGRSSGVAFALYGFSLSSDDGNRKENYRYGKLAEILQEKLMAREFDCRVLTFVYLLLNHWQEPLQKSLSPLLSAYRVGMEKGDIDYAFQAAGAYLTLYWYSGHDLRYGVSESKRFATQMLDYKQQKALTIYQPLFRCMKAMSGSLEDAMKSISEMETEQKEIEFANTTLMSYQMQLAYYFGRMDQAEEFSTKLQAVSKSFNAHYLFVSRLFFFGMIALRVALDTTGTRKSNRLKSTAKRVIKEMEQWTRHGGLNCLHKLLILKAELQGYEFHASNQSRLPRRCRRHIDFEIVRAAFDTAIAISTRTGFRNDAAVAAERASAFFQRCGSTFLAESYQSRAATFYMEWGAVAIVEQMGSVTSGSIAFDFSSRSQQRGLAHQRSLPEIDHGRLDMSHLHSSASQERGSMFFSDSHIKADLSPEMLEVADEEAA